MLSDLLAHPAERKHERHIETTTKAAVWAKRSFGYVPGSDQEGGTLSRSAEQRLLAIKLHMLINKLGS